MAADFTVSADLSYTAADLFASPEYLNPSTVTPVLVIPTYIATADTNYFGPQLFTSGGGGGASARPASGLVYPRPT